MVRNEINSAFEILLEEIENLFESLNGEGEKLLNNQNYEKAKILIENASQLVEFREKVKILQKEWKNIFNSKLPPNRKKSKKSTKLKRGLRTNEDEFRVPILESLIELDGKAKMNEVLQKVSIKMENKLNKYDKETLPSGINQIRWENTAQWCRNTLVKEGFLSSDSSRGIWEITDSGREYFEKEKNK